MNNIAKLINTRRSVRTYDNRTLDEETKEKLLSYANTIQNPFNIPVKFKLLDAKKNGLTCPVVSGTELYVGGKIKNVPNSNVAFGYSFEEFVLYAQSLGLGTVWLGGTMNRAAFEQAMELGEDEMMPCATPIGYTAKKMSMRENMMHSMMFTKALSRVKSTSHLHLISATKLSVLSSICRRWDDGNYKFMAY